MSIFDGNILGWCDMKEKIGNIELDYTYYSGQDLYSDGDIEDYLLDIVKNERQREELFLSNSWPILYHLSEIRENILEWYSFTDHAKTLEIGSGCGALTGLLSNKSEKVTCIELSKKRSLINAYRNKDCDNVTIIVGNFQDIESNIDEQFDYITLIGVWEYAALYVDGTDPYLQMLEIAKKHLKKDGKIIIAIENKMGLKYWNGAPEDHTNNLYSGLNDYIDNKNVRTFSNIEIEKLLETAYIKNYSFYYPMPDYKLPETIYSDDILPEAGTERNYGKDYDTCRLYNFNDAIVSDQLCVDKMFPYFANSFLIIIGEENKKSIFEKYSRYRKEEFQIRTEIYKENNNLYVKKIALNQYANDHIIKLKENEMKWKGTLPLLEYVDGYIDEGEYITKYIQGLDLDTLFYTYRNDAALFMDRFCYYIDTFLKPDESLLEPFCVSKEFIEVFGEQYPCDQKSLKNTNVDLIFSNLKLTADHKLYSFDYEWVFDFLIPYEYVIWSSASQLYNKYAAYLKNQISKANFLTKVGITEENIKIYEQMDKNFGYYVSGKDKTANYLSNYRKSSVMQNFKFM